MERYQINLNTPINNSRELLIRDIEFDTNSFVFTLGENSEAGLNVGDTVFYERMLYAGDGEYVIVNDEAEIIEKQEEGFFKNLTVEDYIMWSGKVIKKGTKGITIKVSPFYTK